jgi:hypothetical protein
MAIDDRPLGLLGGNNITHTPLFSPSDRSLTDVVVMGDKFRPACSGNLNPFVPQEIGVRSMIFYAIPRTSCEKTKKMLSENTHLNN